MSQEEERGIGGIEDREAESIAQTGRLVKDTGRGARSKTETTAVIVAVNTKTSLCRLARHRVVGWRLLRYMLEEVQRRWLL